MNVRWRNGSRAGPNQIRRPPPWSCSCGAILIRCSAWKNWQPDDCGPKCVRENIGNLGDSPERSPILEENYVTISCNHKGQRTASRPFSVEHSDLAGKSSWDRIAT